MTSNFCTACGNRLQPHQHFCPRCGAPVDNAPVGLATPPAPAYGKPAVSRSATRASWRGRARIVAALLVVIVVVANRVIFPLFGNALPADVATFSLGRSGAVDSMAWSPDGIHFAAATEEYDAGTESNRVVVQVWEVASGHLVTTFSGNPSNITALAWSGDGREIVSGSANQQQQGTPEAPAAALIQVWNAATGQTVVTYSTHEVDALAWAPDGHAIVSGGLDAQLNTEVVEWNMRTRSAGARYPTQHIQLMSNVTGLAWSPDGNSVVAVGQGLALWNAATGTLRWSNNSSEEQVAWSPDSRYLVSYGVDLRDHVSGGAFNGPYVSETQRIKVWDAATGKNIATIQTGGLDAMDLVWLPGGRIAAVLYDRQGGSTGTVSAWSVPASGQAGGSPCTNQFPFTRNETTINTSHRPVPFHVQHAQLSPDGKRLAVDWGAGRTIDVWQVSCVSSE